MPCNVLFGLTISPVTYRLTCSNPSARRNKSRYGRSPFRIVSGTPTIGNMVCPSSSSLEYELLYRVPRTRAINPPSRVTHFEGDDFRHPQACRIGDGEGSAIFQVGSGLQQLPDFGGTEHDRQPLWSAGMRDLVNPPVLAQRDGVQKAQRTDDDGKV